MIILERVRNFQVLFNYGYNTHDFLTDFLQYYNSRPPFAYNCIYEEKVSFILSKIC